MIKKHFIIGTVSLIVSLFIGTAYLVYPASAAEFIAPQRDTNGQIRITTRQADDVYAAGSGVFVNGIIGGDLYAAGGVLEVLSSITEDATLAGDTIVINSNVGDDLRAAGRSITVNARVSGDALLAGNTITLASAPVSRVDGDMIAAGEQIFIDGVVRGDVRLYGEKVTINGEIGGELVVYARSLTFGPDSSVKGKITYTGAKPAVIDPGATLSPITFEKAERRGGFRHFMGFIICMVVLKLLAIMVAALVVFALMRKKVTMAVEMVREKMLLNFGVGFVGAIVVPLAIMLLCVSIIGYYTAFIAIAWFALSACISTTISVFFLGSWVAGLFKKQALHWSHALVGVLVLGICFAIPVVGWIAAAISWFTAFGAMLRMMKKEIIANR